MSRKADLPTPDGRASLDATFNRRTLLAAGTGAALTLAFAPTAFAAPKFQRIPVQYIAALADPMAHAGINANEWGLWRLDPGPRGVRLDRYEQLKANNGIAPAQWQFNPSGWWLEEHGLIMEAPDFPMPAGQYLVTGNREKQAMLTVNPAKADGTQYWELDNEATIYDVTHLRCRSALYTPEAGTGSCTPAHAIQSDFPVRPGAEMPPVAGCSKQDYAVLIVYAIAVEDA